MPHSTSACTSIKAGSCVATGDLHGTAMVNSSFKNMSKKDNNYMDDDKFEEDLAVPKPSSYRVSFEQHPFTIGLSMFDDDSDSESDDDDDDKGSDTGRGDDYTISFDCKDQVKTNLQQAQSVTFREAATISTRNSTTTTDRMLTIIDSLFTSFEQENCGDHPSLPTGKNTGRCPSGNGL